MLDVTVKRSEWGRGNGSYISALYNPMTNKRCCLGFAGNAAGFTDEQMSYSLTPFSFQRKDLSTNRIITDALIDRDIYGESYDSLLCNRLMCTNDSSVISEEERESRLIELGKEAGINFTFVD